MRSVHLCVPLFVAAKANLVTIFKFGGPKIKEAIAYILQKAAQSIRRKKEPVK